MTELYINNRPAWLPTDFSIALTSENPYFTSSSAYSLDIDLPMPDNIGIFGHIHRLDAGKQKTILPARLVAGARTLLNGSAVLLSISDEAARVQLVSGNAELNILTNEDIYIDELDLGTVPDPDYYGDRAWKPAADKPLYFGSVDQVDAVWMPVAYDGSSGNRLMNLTLYQFGTDAFKLVPVYGERCVQPYLLAVVRRLVEHFGYTLDEGFFDGNFLRNVYICNAVSTRKVARALPHWTVSEFFDELERFLMAVTVVDELTKTVRLVPLNDYFRDDDLNIIPATDVLAQYEAEIDEDGGDKNLTDGNVGYDLPSHTDNGYLRMDRTIYDRALKQDYDDYTQLSQAWQTMDAELRKTVLFRAGNRCYINYRDEEGTDSLKEVNLYADLVRDADRTDTDTALRIVPAEMVLHDLGLWSSPTDYGFVSPFAPLNVYVPKVGYHVTVIEDEEFDIQQAIEGEVELPEKQEKNTVMEVAFSTGEWVTMNVTYQGQTYPWQYALPFTDYALKPANQTTGFRPYSLSLQDVCADSLGRRLSALKVFRSNIPYTISFLSDRLPDVNKVFLIANKKYLCEKIEASVTHDGLDRVMKGTFYRIE